MGERIKKYIYIKLKDTGTRWENTGKYLRTRKLVALTERQRVCLVLRGREGG